MSPIFFVCTLVFSLVLFAFGRMALDRGRGRRERVLSGTFFALLLTFFSSVDGCSPVTGIVHVWRVDALCSEYSVGSPFDPEQFKQRARAHHVRAGVLYAKKYAFADATEMLLVSRQCNIEYSDGKAVRIDNYSHEP
jgi:hypothetical protein